MSSETSIQSQGLHDRSASVARRHHTASGEASVPPSLQLKFTGGKKNVLNCEVKDEEGKVRYTFKKGEHGGTAMIEPGGTVVATMHWNMFSPNMLQYEDQEVKIRDWVPLMGRKSRRTIIQDKSKLEWVKIDGVQALQIRPGVNAAIWSNRRGAINVEMLPDGLRMNLTQEVVLCVAILESGHKLGKGIDPETVDGTRGMTYIVLRKLGLFALKALL